MKNQKIIDILQRSSLLIEEQHIVLGLSGGPDSVCLFDALCQLAEEKRLTLHPVHVNHQIRPGAADADQAYVEQLCHTKGWDCTVHQVDCEALAKKLGRTTEEAGRMARYDAFREKAKSLESQGVPKDHIAIALAHHADDQAETILFRILRGTGTDGLAGMLPKRQDEAGYTIIRPLLEATKDDILDYCKARNLQPCQDHTNEESLYARNRIRLELLPELANYNPEIRTALLRLGEIAAEDREALEELAQAAYEEDCLAESATEITLRCSSRKPAIAHREYALALRKLGLAEDLSHVHYQALQQLVTQTENPSGAVNLPHGYRGLRRYGTLVLQAPGTKDNWPSASGSNNPNPSLAVRELSRTDYEAMKCGLEEGQFIALDGDLLRQGKFSTNAEITLRTRRPGDYLVIRGGGRKKLQNLFVDEKIPKDLRDQIPLVALGGEVLWIPNLEIGRDSQAGQAGKIQSRKGRYTANYLLFEGTKNVILIEINWDL